MSQPKPIEHQTVNDQLFKSLKLPMATMSLTSLATPSSSGKFCEVKWCIRISMVLDKLWINETCFLNVLKSLETSKILY